MWILTKEKSTKPKNNHTKNFREIELKKNKKTIIQKGICNSFSETETKFKLKSKKLACKKEESLNGKKGKAMKKRRKITRGK